MDFPCVFIVLAHALSTYGVGLEKPMSLLVLSNDLLSLENPVQSDRVEDRVIKYDDELSIVVKRYSEAADKKDYLLVDGTVTLAKLKGSSEHDQKLHSVEEINKIFFRNGQFYFEDVTFEPEFFPEDYFIVNYQPTEIPTHVKPVIEYMPKLQFESELYNSIPKIISVGNLTGALLVKTYFRMADGVKLYAEFDLYTKIVVFKGNFIIIANEMGVNNVVNLNRMHFDLVKMSFCEYSALGEVVSVRVLSLETLEKVKDLYLRITRKQLLKDVLQSSPSPEMSSSGIFGMIKYDRYRVFTLKYISTNQRQVLHITGRFVTQDGDDLCCICVAFPEDQQKDKSSVILPDKPVFFSCSPDITTNTEILLQEDTDFIAMKNGYYIVADSKPLSQDFSNKPARVEPYLEYFSYEQFLRALIIVTDAMKIQCANGYRRKSFRLFLDVFLVYDCNSEIVYFDLLDLWSPDRQTSYAAEFPHFFYYSKSQRFVFEDKSFSDFKLRQLHPNFPEKIPREIKYMYDANYGKTDIAVDIRSLEWDLSNIRKSLFKTVSPLPQTFGIISLEDEVLIRAEKLQQVVDGKKELMVVVTGLYDNCLKTECKEKYQLVYDGWKLVTKDSRGAESENLLNKIYLPKTFKLPLLDHMTVAHQERYFTLTSFRFDMEDMTKRLQECCKKLKGTPEYDEKLTIYVYYLGSKEPMIGYYDCGLMYVSFFSDFKVIKYSNVDGRSRSYQPGEELKFTQNRFKESFNAGDSRELIYRPEDAFDAEEAELRKKYSDYILRGLIYDQKGRVFHSRSLFVAEVYALRLLPSYIKEATLRRGGYKFKVKRRAEVVVYGQDAPKTAWM